MKVDDREGAVGGTVIQSLGNVQSSLGSGWAGKSYGLGR